MRAFNAFTSSATFIIWIIYIFNPDPVLKMFLCFGIGWVCGQLLGRSISGDNL